MKLRYRLATRLVYCVWHTLFGFRVEGRENIPLEGGVIIAANHLSSYDAPLIGAAVWSRECYFFALQDIFVISKFFSWLMHKVNAYAVDSKKPSREALRYTMRLLERGLGIVLFPEGTRSKKGHFLDFSPGVGWFALKCQVPVVPALIEGVNTSLASQLIRRNRACVRFGVPVVPSEFEPDKRQGGFRSVQEKSKVVAQEVEKRVKELHGNS